MSIYKTSNVMITTQLKISLTSHILFFIGFEDMAKCRTTAHRLQTK